MESMAGSIDSGKLHSPGSTENDKRSFDGAIQADERLFGTRRIAGEGEVMLSVREAAAPSASNASSRASKDAQPAASAVRFQLGQLRWFSV